jgi:hypothetical protein
VYIDGGGVVGERANMDYGFWIMEAKNEIKDGGI